ncbi:hypothetical protein EV189_0649 [Motilibacter rhizosphaerae]|uniref:Uncharacterized protein n=1 Tax=Motilibacter rhizosphaerae TaxID=598652 RepID=A0A4Q7NWW2_9ACTN|nr:hypothetical protein [Motilibacter rhizosphaerae]RZS91408.1 hypothetical protein EV189_0649 [Motilibacter rhizosphaerae]
MVDPVDAVGRLVPGYTPGELWSERRRGTDPTTSAEAGGQAGKEQGRPARDARAGAKGTEDTTAKPPVQEPSRPDIEITRRQGKDGGPSTNVVTVLNPETGKPIYQSPPEGVLVMLESALWRLRKKETDDVQ